MVSKRRDGDDDGNPFKVAAAHFGELPAGTEARGQALYDFMYGPIHLWFSATLAAMTHAMRCLVTALALFAATPVGCSGGSGSEASGCTKDLD